MRILPYGPTAVLVELDAAEDVPALYGDLVGWRAGRRARAVVTTGDIGAVDIVPGYRTVLVDGVDDPVALTAMLRHWQPPPPTQRPAGPLLELPTIYDGDDLPDVAARWGVGPGDVAAMHADTSFTVAFCGFAPGFAYLTGLPEHLQVPRRPTPRPVVPAGAVGLAGPFTGVYPRPSPGGWQLVGRLAPGAPVLWEQDRPAPALLAPGTRVRFVPVDP